MTTVSVKCVLGHYLITIIGARHRNIVGFDLIGSDGKVLIGNDAGRAGGDDQFAQAQSCGRAFDGQHVTYRFVTDRISDPLIATGIESGPLRAAIRFDGEAGAEEVGARLERSAITDFGALAPQVRRRLAQAPHIGGMFSALAAGNLKTVETGPVSIEYAHQMNGVLFVNGLLPNFGALDVYVMTDGGAHVAAPGEMIGLNRTDVSDFMVGKGNVTPATDTHGFCAVLPRLNAESSLIVGILRGNEFYVLYDRKPDLAPSPDRIFPLVLNAWQTSSNAPLSKGVTLMSPFLRKGGTRADATVRYRAGFTAAQPAAVSVVVPFYKEWRFLYSVLVMVRRSPDDWEWVIVCDDPAIAPLMLRLIAMTPAPHARKITFLEMKANVGYGAANNAGVAAASSDKVLLMNSDVWMADFDAVQFGLAALAAGTFALIGFTLLFEDGTIQHDGLEFRRSAEMDMMYLVLHPGKGLPALRLGDQPELVPAVGVTGALMLVSRREFLDRGGFSDRYIGGDFEDADFCLELARHGRGVGMVRSRQIFHLERQSIRKDAANNVGFARTVVNCHRFNRAWGGYLDGHSRSAAPSAR